MRESKNIILFDGVCNLCNGFVQFVIKRDKKAVFKFVSLQSETGQEILQPHLTSPKGRNKLSPDELVSVIYIKNGKVFSHSEAVIRIASKLGGIWELSSALLIIPAFIRDFVYNFIAKNRYRFFGKRDSCMMPTEELKSRFL